MENSNTSPKPYKLGIALSGGGARGFAHAGALKAIKEAGLEPDVLAGVSAGSVVAVMYAAGVDPDDMVGVFDNTGLTNLTEFRLGGGGLFKIEKFIKLIMKSIAPCKNFEDLKIPTYVGATDLDNACVEVFNSGSIAERMMASCSIPIVFRPVRINGTNYVDGGVLQNLPASHIRDKCEKLIGINVSPMMPYKRTNSVIDVAIRTYNLMAKANQRIDMDLCDLVVETCEISAYSVFNLKGIEQVFTAGYANARHALREAGWWQANK